MRIILTLTVFLLSAPLPQAAQSSLPQNLPTIEQAQAGLDAGLSWLLEHQEPNGAWGHWRNPEANSWTNPATQMSWQVATTAIGAVTLMQTYRGEPDRIALDRAMNYLFKHAHVKRPELWDADNTGAYVYALDAFTQAAQHSHFKTNSKAATLAKIEKSGKEMLRLLWDYQSPQGGWAYYADEALTARPWWATSFQTAIAIMGILRAKECGWSIEEKRLKRAIQAVLRCRLPNGAYSYSIENFPSPGGGTNINQVKGSLSRIQVCNLALYRADQAGYETGIGFNEMRKGLAEFWGEHRFLDIANRKPIPHEAYYYNSGYFYFFGHYYAAQVIESLPTAERAPHRKKLWHHVLKTQAKDGSCWDYKMNEYGKPYGVGFMTYALSVGLTQS